MTDQPACLPILACFEFAAIVLGYTFIGASLCGINNGHNVVMRGIIIMPNCTDVYSHRQSGSLPTILHNIIAHSYHTVHFLCPRTL